MNDHEGAASLKAKMGDRWEQVLYGGRWDSGVGESTPSWMKNFF